MARPTNPLESFFWGAGGQPMTEEEIAREREIAQLLTGQVDMSPVGHWTQGAARMAQALAGRVREGRANRAAGENADYNRSIIESLFSPSGGSTAPVTAAPAPSDPPTPATSALMRGTGGGGDYFAAIRAAESGGNDAAKNPLSSATGRYQFIQSTWDGLRRKYPELGLTPDGRTDPEQQERAIKAFTADNANVLQSAGIPITGGNLYAAHFLGAGGARDVLTSDPTTPIARIVGDGVVKANPFLRGMSVADFQNWAAKKGGSGPVDIAGTQPAAPVQVASLDPSIGMPQEPAQETAGLFVGTPDQMPPATAPVPTPRPEMTAQAMPAQMMDPQGMGGPAQGFAMPQGMPQQAPAPAPQPAQTPGIDPRIIQALSDPRVDGNTKRIAAMLLQQQQAQQQAFAEQQALQNDPLRQLQIQKGQLELEAMRNPKPQIDGAVVGNRIIDRNTGKVIYEGEPEAAGGFRPATPEEAQRFGAAAGQFGPDNRFYPLNPPQGTSLSVDPNTGAVTFNQGAGVKPLTEVQSKDVGFATRATAAIPVIDQYEKSLLSLGGALAESIPMNLGNYAQTEEYQLARDAGRDFLATILRKDSGAAITTNEEQIYGRMFLPQPGDKPATLTAKRQRRALAVEAIKAGMPPSAIESMTKALDTSAEKPLSEMTDEELEAIANGNR